MRSEVCRPTRDRRPTSCGFATVLVCALLMAVTAAGQDIDKDRVIGGLSFVDQVEVTVVNLSVFVRDREGRPVEGLTKENFRLLQDGIERPLTHFSAYSDEVIGGLAPGLGADIHDGLPPPSDDDEPIVGTPDVDAAAIQPVHIVIYVDNENLRPFDRNRVLAQVRRFVGEVMQPHVKVMVISVQRSAKTVQSFSNDPRAVKDSLRSLNQTYGGRVDQDRQRGRIIHDLQAVMNDGSSDGLRNDPAAARDLEARIRSYAEELTIELGYSLTTLREVLTTLAGLPGRKILVHVSSGLPAVPARDLINWYGDLFQKNSTLPMLARFNLRSRFEAVAASANAQGVTFYTIDASGLAGDASASAEYSRPVDPMISGIYVINHQEPLLLMAERTGGRAIVDSNDVTSLLEEMRNDLFTYYSLGYTLSPSGADTVHRLDVELLGHPEYNLVFRRTLVEKSLETQVQDQVVSGLMLALEDNPMALDLTPGAVKPASDGLWVLPIEVGLPIDSVALLPEAEEFVGRVVIFLANRDMQGRRSDVQRRIFEIRMPPGDYETRRGERYVAAFDLLLDEGKHKIVVGVLDPVTRQTSFQTLTQAVPGSAR